MEVIVEPFKEKDIEDMIQIWNEVVDEGVAFPQMEELTKECAEEFFGSQDYVGVAKVNGQIEGLYILHPNNVGRCGHQANASYAVRLQSRGQRIGEKLVRDSMIQAKRLNYKLLIFNAVVKDNERAIQLYQKLGFVKIGEVSGGFLQKDGTYQDTIMFYHSL